MIEVYKMLRGFEGTDEVKFFQRGVGCTRGHGWKLFKKRGFFFLAENLVSEIGFVTNGTGCQGGLSMWRV